MAAPDHRLHFESASLFRRSFSIISLQLLSHWPEPVLLLSGRELARFEAEAAIK